MAGIILTRPTAPLPVNAGHQDKYTAAPPACGEAQEWAQALVDDIRRWGRELGFQQVGIAPLELEEAGRRLDEWLRRGWHGDMRWMATHGSMRYRPAELVPGALCAIVARMDYTPEAARPAAGVLDDPTRGYVARYALGRDYHKLLRQRLKTLAERIARAARPHGYRVLVDSAPLMEKPLAASAGLGWQGKHTNLINRHAGSWFLLGEILTDLPLPADQPVQGHCGSCRACLDVCPTGAIVAPWQLDARRCISYLTIESRQAIPADLRPLIGNRIFGCDDCQLVCPWNRYAHTTAEGDFQPRHGLDSPALVELMGWTEAEWDMKTRGSALRRPGYEGWLRNVAVALGNAPPSAEAAAALRARLDHPSALVREHVRWALGRQLRTSGDGDLDDDVVDQSRTAEKGGRQHDEAAVAGRGLGEIGAPADHEVVGPEPGGSQALPARRFQ